MPTVKKWTEFPGKKRDIPTHTLCQCLATSLAASADLRTIPIRRFWPELRPNTFFQRHWAPRLDVRSRRRTAGTDKSRDREPDGFKFGFGLSASDAQNVHEPLDAFAVDLQRDGHAT